MPLMFSRHPSEIDALFTRCSRAQDRHRDALRETPAQQGGWQLYFELYLNNLKGFTLHAIPDATAAQEVADCDSFESKLRAVRRCRTAPRARPRPGQMQMC